jgi:hypothetical protein
MQQEDIHKARALVERYTIILMCRSTERMWRMRDGLLSEGVVENFN